MEKFKPRKEVKKIVCPKCKELLLKIYPNGLLNTSTPGVQIRAVCMKCENEEIRKRSLKSG